MEYVQWGSLNHIIKKGKISEKNARTIIKDVFEAIREVHSQDFMHRDLKPANILITSKGAKVCDFGLTLKVGKGFHDQAWQVGGTIIYESPE